MVAHQWATLDYVSNGRAILGVGLGREHHYRQFEVPDEGRVRRFREEVELIKALWTQEKVDYHGRIYQMEEERCCRSRCRNRICRCGWASATQMRSAARRRSPTAGWDRAVEHRRVRPIGADAEQALEQTGRDPETFPDLEADIHGGGRAAGSGARRAPSLVHRGISQSAGTDASGIHGTPEQVRERLEEVVAMGANHLLLNPVSRHVEQVEAVAEVVGLS